MIDFVAISSFIKGQLVALVYVVSLEAPADNYHVPQWRKANQTVVRGGSSSLN